MTPRDRMVVQVIGLVAILGLIWFTVIGPRHKQYGKVSASLTSAQDRLDTAQQTLKAAQAAKASYSSDYSQIAQLGKAVPVDDEVPSLVYQLSSAAKQHDIDFRSVKLDDSGTSAAAAPAATATPAPTSTTGTTATTATTTTATTDTTATPAAGATATPAATSLSAATLPPGASIGSAGFPVMPFDFVFDGSFFNMGAFLKQLNQFTTVSKNSLVVRGRLLTIDGIAITSSRNGFPKIKATISSTAFLLPSEEGLTAGATPTAPADTTTASATGATGTTTPPAATAKP